MPTQIIVDKRFRQFEDEMNTAVKAALTDAGRVGAMAAQAKETRRLTGALHSGIHARPPEWLPGRGYIVAIVAHQFYAIFQELGTLGGRRRKLKASTLRRRASGSGAERFAKVSGRGGIKGLHFLSAGRRAGQAVLIDRLRAHFPR